MNQQTVALAKSILSRNGRAAEFEKAWEEAADRLKASVRKGEKVFEVHHSMEVARGSFLNSLVFGCEPYECRDAALERMKRVQVSA